LKPRITVLTLRVKPSQSTFYGGYGGYFQDPEGHLWEVAWNPARRVAE
jgi:uncharacterized protein